MIVIGLTGSIGMGKSTTAALFRDEGVPVYDADAVVHALYGGEAVPAVAAVYPDAITGGIIDRGKLRELAARDQTVLARLEAAVHPLVRAREKTFLDRQRTGGARMVVLDIPLLLESGGAERCSASVVVTAAPAIQRERVMAREGMTEAVFHTLLERQMPDAEKRQRAHFLVDSSHGLPSARRQVQAIIRALAGG